MCRWGDLVMVTVPRVWRGKGLPKHKTTGIDRCIAPTMAYLVAQGFDTVASCCTHGQTPWARISLRDGTEIRWPSPSWGQAA